MCGIAGFISLKKNMLGSEHLWEMIDEQRHRGPDDVGVEILNLNNPTVIFAHCRLAIIDTSPAGHQPMQNLENGSWIVYNGEIYNFAELRDDLKGFGCNFHTETDTEVILKAYAIWGFDCVHRLRGIFAFGIWDPQKRLLFCVRDQLGVKPFYYYQTGGTLLFASEVRGILASGIVPRKIDLYGLRSYLAYGSLQDPLSMISGIRSLLPGHTLTWRDGKISISCYWRLLQTDTVGSELSPDMFDGMLDCLEKAVRLQKIADVPLGTFLSGGIDSTAITALLQRETKSPVRSFSVIFDEENYDERLYSQLAAKYIGTEHTELRLSGEMVRTEIGRAMAAYDQPSLDGLNTYFISKVTKAASITVALSGLGGDELFGGYNGYCKTLKIQKWGKSLRKLPEVLRRGLLESLILIPQFEHARKLSELLHNKVDPYFISRQLFSTEQVRSLLAYEIFQASENWIPVRFTQLINSVESFDSINRASALEIQTYMLSTLLRDTDQMSMAHALEVRVPFLDTNLVEYVFSLPGKYKINSKQPKVLLTKSLGDSIPKECIFRPKMGFTLPLEDWLRKSLLPLMDSAFSSNSDPDIFSSKGLAAIWKQFQLGQINWSRVWSLFILCDWLKRHGISL